MLLIRWQYQIPDVYSGIFYFLLNSLQTRVPLLVILGTDWFNFSIISTVWTWSLYIDILFKEDSMNSGEIIWEVFVILTGIDDAEIKLKSLYS